jgi:hypothetical protein
MYSYIGLYGSVKLIKALCHECQLPSFILDGYTACCGIPQFEQPLRYYREALTAGRRQPPPLQFRRAQLALQDNRCFYCNRPFHRIVWRGTRSMRLRIEWDHMAPFAYLQSNPLHNFVAACHVCNRLKGDYCFDTIEEACFYVQRLWPKKGYRDTR